MTDSQFQDSDNDDHSAGKTAIIGKKFEKDDDSASD